MSDDLNPTPSAKQCIICECDDKDSFSHGQWKKKAGRARLCLDCMELDIETEVPPEIEDRFTITDVATQNGWTYDGPRAMRGEYTLARGASLSFSRDSEGSVQHVYFWPSTGTTCSELLHPEATEKTQLYRHSTAEHCRDMLHLILRNPRQHTGVGYYWAADGQFLGMGYDEADELMREAAGNRGSGSDGHRKGRSGGGGGRGGRANHPEGSDDDDDAHNHREKKSSSTRPHRPLQYFVDNKLDEECNLYQLGKCYYGIYCRRIHVGNVPLVPREKVDEVCRDYQRGGCRCGDNCIRRHED